MSEKVERDEKVEQKVKKIKNVLIIGTNPDIEKAKELLINYGTKALVPRSDGKLSECDFLTINICHENGDIIEAMSDDGTLTENERFETPVVFIYSDLLTKLRALFFDRLYLTDWPHGMKYQKHAMADVNSEKDLLDGIKSVIE